jgi:endoglucanase
MATNSSTTDTLVLTLAEAAYQGNAAFTVSVDGIQIGGVQTVSALQASGQAQAFTINGNFGSGPHVVDVTFLNPLKGTNAATTRSLYLQSLSLDGNTVTTNTAVTASTAETITAATPPSATDTLTLNVSEAAYAGNAEFLVLVDGVQVGGTQTVTASKAAGASQNIALTGNFGTGPHDVVVDYINAASGSSSGQTRTLYVNTLTYDGTVSTVNQTMTANGVTTPVTVSDVATITPGPVVKPAATAPSTDTLTLDMAEDAYLGNAEFTVSVDGKQVGGTMTVTALNSAGAVEAFTLTGAWGTGAQAVTVNFINDAYGGSASKDRNLYVKSIVYNGEVQASGSATLLSNGGANFSVQAPPQTTATTTPSTAQTAPADTLTLYVAEDYYLGDAQFSVTVDGKQVGGTLTATASHVAGDVQPITLYGNFGTGPQTVVVTFLNDANGGSPLLDRNLYVNAIDYNGVYTPVGAALLSTGNSSTTVVGASGTPATPLAPMAPAGELQYVGVNLSGLEGNGTHPGVDNVTYTSPTDAEINEYASEGMNIIRVPFDWALLQPTLNGPLDQSYLALLDHVVSYAATKGITVDLDMHNYGAYEGNPVGSAAVPNSAFANAWSQLAEHYASTPNVMFGLMNEPSQQTAAQWLTSDNAAIAAIRATGATQEILVPGTDSSEGAAWISSGNANVMLGIVDPDMNFAYDIHQYNDPGASGSSTTVVSPTIGVQNLTDVTQWAEATGSRLFLSEFGSGSDATSLTTMQNMLNYMAANNNVWQGTTEWGGGPWFSSSYGFATDPVNGAATPQVALLSHYAS